MYALIEDMIKEVQILLNKINKDTTVTLVVLNNKDELYSAWLEHANKGNAILETNVNKEMILNCLYSLRDSLLVLRLSTL